MAGGGLAGGVPAAGGQGAGDEDQGGEPDAEFDERCGQRANLYKTIRRLHEAGLITILHTERSQQYPERTVYALTEEGRSTGLRWLTDMLAVPRSEYPAFPAALSFAMSLYPEQLAGVLDQRLAAVQARLADLDAELRDYGEAVPRIALIETEYLRAVTDAEACWLASVIGDLRSGRLAWDQGQIAAQAAEAYFQAQSPESGARG